MVMTIELEILIKIFLSFIIGGVIGIEREIRNKPAGVRTHALVCMGAALFTIISIYGFNYDPVLDSTYVRKDPARIAAQIVSGVGFIGAGLIFKNKDEVQGLTTAASIWLVAAIGTGIGVGLYFPIAAAAVLGFIALKFNHLFQFGEEDNEK